MASRRQRFRKQERRRADQASHRDRVHRDVFDRVSGYRLPSTEVAQENVTVIERVGGPQPRESLHRPRRHPRHEAAILLHDALRQAGVRSEDGTTGGVTAEMVTKFIELVEHVGSPDVAVTQLVDQLLKQRDDQVAEGARRLGVDTAMQSDGIERVVTESRSPSDNSLPTKLSDLHDYTELPLGQQPPSGGSFTITSPLGTTEEIPYDASVEKIVAATEPIGGVAAVLANGSEAQHPSEEEWKTIVETARTRKRSIAKVATSRELELVGENPRERTSWLIKDGESC